jgi:fructose-bisphosphate aldolase, class I
MAPATANPIGLVVGGAVKATGEVSGSETIEGAAERTAKEAAAQQHTAAEEQGWICRASRAGAFASDRRRARMMWMPLVPIAAIRLTQVKADLVVLTHDPAPPAGARDQGRTKASYIGRTRRMSEDLGSIAATLVAEGKGILAADESIATLTRRFDPLGIPSTEQSRRAYREMLFTTRGADAFISGAILYDETIRQKSSSGTPFAEVLRGQGIVPGIKVDTGAEPLAGSPEETVTEGLDGLRERLEDYHRMGARFAKWRAVIRITDRLPSVACVSANAHALARYAALCQEQRLVPIVEPEVLMNGAHTIERCEEVTGAVLHAVFHELFEQGVLLDSMLLKPSMVIAGKDCSRQASVQEVARRRSAACAGMSPRRCPASYSCRAARRTSWPPRI